MKKIITAALLVLALPLLASASTLKTSGTTGVLLRTNTDDSVLVGSPTAFYLEFKDSTKPIDLQADYSFDVTISNNKGVTDEVLPVGWKFVSTNELDFKYTFKTAGSYTLKVVGGAKAAGFENFTVSYDLVAGAAAPVVKNDAPAFKAFGTTKAVTTPAPAAAPTVSPAASTTADAPSMDTVEYLLIAVAILVVIALVVRDLYNRRKIGA